MPSPPHVSTPLRRILAVGLLVCSALLGAVEPHAEHGVEPSIRPALAGEVFQPSACHPHQPAHLEAAGTPAHTHSCAACLHLYRSLGLVHPPLPQPPQAEQARSFPSRPGMSSAGPVATFADPRAPPVSFA